MQITHRLLNGEAVDIGVPAATGLPRGTSIAVLALEGAGQMEVTGGRDGDLAFYLEVTGTTLDREVTLRDGRTLRHGRFAGDPAQGIGWAIPLEGHHLYGFTLPGVDIETLTGHLADVDLQVDPLGPVLTPTGRASWSLYRTQTVAQVVELDGAPLGPDGGGGRGFLLDVRRARTGQAPTARTGSGLRVKGGLLTRSGDDERHRYGVLESTDFVSYGLPGSDDAIDAVLTAMGELTVTLVGGAT